MSVSDPADSGGGSASTTMQDLQAEFANQMETVGGWAELMAEEHLNSTIESEPEDGTDSPDGQVDGVVGPTGRQRRIPDKPPFKIQVTNVPASSDQEDLYFHFGGENAVCGIKVDTANRRADVDFSTRGALIEALNRDGELFEGSILKVFVVQNDKERRAPRSDRDANYGGGRQHDNYQQRSPNQNNNQTSYNRGGGSRYNSQTSLVSNDARNSYDHKRGGYSDRGPPPQHYDGGHGMQQHHTSNRGGFTGRGGGDDYRYGGQQSRGGLQQYDSYRGGRGGSRGGRGGYDYRGGPPMHGGGQRHNSYGGEIQRSGSYSHDRDRPAAINRSRTESSDQRHMDGGMMHQSTASSRLSINTVEENEPRVVVKKPSTKDIFGDAKPVDTSGKLKEVEEKLKIEKEHQKQMEKEQRAAAEASAAAEQQMASNNYQGGYHQQQQQPHPGHYHQNHYPHQQTTHYYHQGPQVHYAMPQIPMNQPPPSVYQQHSPQASHQQTGSRFNGQEPGAVKIMTRRESDHQVPSNAHPEASPPIDPVQPVWTEDGKKADMQHKPRVPSDCAEDRTQASSSTNSVHDGKAKGQQQQQHTRVFRPSGSQPLQKSATSGTIHEQTQHAARGSTSNTSHRGSRGAKGGRGGGTSRGAGTTGAPPGNQMERRSSYTSGAANTGKHEPAKDTKPPAPESKETSKSDKKDHHGSQASLRSRGGHAKRGGPGRGGVNQHQAGNYSQRNQQQDRTKEQRPQRPSDNGNPSAPAKVTTAQAASGTQQKEEANAKKEPVKVVSKPPVAPAPAPTVVADSSAKPSAPPVDDNKEKKKDNKKKKNTTNKKSAGLNGNKFAALLDADD